MEVQFSTEIPAIYDQCHKQFGVEWDKGVIFTYGDTIYCKHPLPADFVEHEMTHVRQQGEIGVNQWWGKYLTEPEFRLSQEVEAYRNQLKYIRKHWKDREAVARKVHTLVMALCGTMYGKVCTYSEARKLLV